MDNGQLLVLVLDDDKAVRNSLKFALELEGFEARVFASSDDLLADMGSKGAGCIVIDHDMASIGGIDVLARLRAGGCFIPAILMSDRSASDLRRGAAALGVQHVVEKPLLNGTLMAGIRDVLGLSSSSSKDYVEVPRR